MDRFEYMKVKLDIIPKEVLKQYNLKEIATDGWIYIEIGKWM